MTKGQAKEPSVLEAYDSERMSWFVVGITFNREYADNWDMMPMKRAQKTIELGISKRSHDESF